MKIYQDYHSQGYEFVAAWTTAMNDPDLVDWMNTNGWSVGTHFTDYCVDDGSAYTPYKDAYWSDNNFIPKNFLIDRDGYVRARANTTNEATWGPLVEELL